jgi:hypothetical protein
MYLNLLDLLEKGGSSMKYYFRYLSKLVPVFFVFIFALALTQFFGTSGFLGQDAEAKIIQEEGVFDEETIAFDKANQNLGTAMNVQDRHTDVLMSQPGIVGTATGLNEQGRPAILVFAESFELARGASIPSDIEGIPVVVKITGKIFAMPGPPPGKGPGSGGGGGGGGDGDSVDPKARFDRAVPIGVSTGNVNECSAGTIGCRVTDGTDVYALSNNHIYARQNNASIGESVQQPGLYDADPQCAKNTADTIGTLEAFEPILTTANNVIDAAIALSTEADLGNATPSDGYGLPNSAIAVGVDVGDPVQKYGRTTSLTKGTIAGINATVNVGYSSGTARFVDQIIVGGSKGPFIKAGDSGSLLVTDSTDNNPVGLLFAGSSSGKTAVANPIDAVLIAFSVTIDGK